MRKISSSIEMHTFASKNEAEVAAKSLGFVYSVECGWHKSNCTALIDYHDGDWKLTILKHKS